MKAAFRHDGTLVLTPENGTEAFALKAWHDKSDEGLAVLITPEDGEQQYSQDS